MEGEGEGMVAIVQGLRDAGLAVTVMGGRRQRKRQYATDARLGQLIHAKSSVETSTNGLPPIPSVSTAAQICDGRYTSSYQLAHCLAMPSSPPVESTEFPPQRAEPNRSVFCSHTSKCAEAFAHSLRRYPSLSPNRSISSDLLQRLLAYTQAKNFSKSSYHTNSLRHLRNKNNDPQKDIPSKTKLCKSVQTYTRAMKKKENASPVDIGRRDKDGGASENKELRKDSKKSRSRSPQGSVNLRLTDDDIIATFDYLNSYSRRFNQSAEVRYLNDVTRVLRNTLRQICDDRPRVCPNIQYRYSQHRREHHNAVGGESSSDSNNVEGQGSLPMVSTGVAAMSSCEAIPGTYQQTCPSCPKICCFCRKPLPCACGKTAPPVHIQKFRSSSDGSPYLSKETSLDKTCRSRCGRSSISFDIPDDIDNKLEEEVMDWLQQIPVYANNNFNDKSVRENMARNLINKLKELKDDEDFMEKARAEIVECVMNMPMWCPGNSNDQNIFREQIVDNLVNKLRDIINLRRDKFVNIISKWFDGLNFGMLDGQIVNKREVVDNLASSLKTLALNPLPDKDDFKTALKYEIIGVLNELPIEVDGDKTSFINKMADNLASKLQYVPAKDILKTDTDSKQDIFGDEMKNWVESLNLKTTDSQGQIIDKSVIADQFISALKPIILSSPQDKEMIKDKILEVLQHLPFKANGDRGKLLDKLADNLTNKLQNIPIQDISKSVNDASERLGVNLEDAYQKQIWDWVKDIPEFSHDNGNNAKNKKLVESLAKQLKEIQSHGIDNMQMQNKINEWLVNNFQGRGHLDYRTTDELVKKLMGKLVNATKEAEKNKINNSVSDEENVQQEIWDWLDNLLELTKDIKAENTKTVKNLSKKLIELLSQSNDDSELEDEIHNFLSSLLENLGQELDVRNKNNSIKILLSRIIKLIKEKDENYLVREILNCLEDIPEFDKHSRENKEMTEEFSKKVNIIQQTQKAAEAVKEELNDELVNWLNGVIESSRAQLKITDKNRLIQKLMNVLTALPKPKERKRWAKQSPKKLVESLKEEVGNILDESQISADNRDDIESALTEIMADQVLRGEDDNQTKNRLVRALKGFNISQEQSEDIANTLLDIGKEMSLINKTQDSFIINEKRKFHLSPLHKKMFQESAEREILDFAEEISGEDSQISRKKRKSAAQKLAERIGDIISERETTNDDKRENIESEIPKHIDNLTINTDVTIDEVVSRLADRLHNLALNTPKRSSLDGEFPGFKASTPKRSSMEKGFSFRPRRGSRDSMISTIEDLASMLPTQPPSKEEQKYASHIGNQIDDWIKDLPLDLISAEGKELKEMMIKDLAADIIDRQKYLQLNPDTKTSDEEELEHLKYQVFRWLNKLTDVTNLLDSISKTEDLMDRIGAVSVPQLIKSDRRSNKTTRESSVQHLSNELASLQNEITKWFDAIVSKYKASKDEKHKHENVKDLAEEIDQLKKEKALTEAVFDDVVSGWLQKMLKDASDNYINSLTEGLKSVVIDKEVAQSSKEIQKRKPSISASGIKAAIFKWAQDLPFQSGKTIKNANKHVEKFVPTVKKVFTNVEPDNFDDIQKNLEKEIKTFLQKLPVHKNKVKDTHVQELKGHLNEMVQDATASQVQSQSLATKSMISKPGIKAADVLYNNIEEWCENLPIKAGNTPEEKERVKTLKQNIASKLINVIGDLNMKPEILNDDSLYEDLLSDEIDDILKSLPPSPELENNLSVLKENLIEKLKEAKKKMQDELAELALKQQIRDAISKTLPSTDNLTIEEQAPFEVLKDNLVDAYIELHYAADNDGVKNKLKTKISDEINKFCNDYLNRYPSSPVDPKKLNRDIFQMLQSIPSPKNETIKSQVEQVRIKDEIKDWLKQLPLKEDETPSEKLQRNKIVNLLAKGLHDIEREKELNPDIDVEERMRKEVKKWIKKLPITTEDKGTINEMVEKLTSKLKDSEESRRFSISGIRCSTDLTEDTNITDCCGSESIRPYCTKFNMSSIPQTSTPRRLSQYVPSFPPTTLSTEDRAHLQRIRERNGQMQPSPSIPCYCKDASVSPIPLDAGSQTDVGQQWQTSSAKSMLPCGPARIPMQPCSWPQAQSDYSPNHQVNQPLSPQILVKEYYWDTGQGESSYMPCENRTLGQSVSQNQNSSPEPQTNQPGRFATPQQSYGPQQFASYPRSQQYVEQLPQTPGMASPTQPLPCRPSPCMRPSIVPSPCMPPTCVPPPCIPPPSLPPPSGPSPCMPSPCRPPPSVPLPCMQHSPSESPPEMQAQSSLNNSYIPDPSIPPCLSQSPPYPTSSQMNPRQAQKTPKMGPSMMESPCTIPPCMSSGFSTKPPCAPTRMRPPCMPKPSALPPESPSSMPRPSFQRECPREPRRPGRSPELSSTSSPYENEFPDGTHFGPKVTRLGSLDDVPCSKTCGSQSPRPKRSRGTPDEDFDWTIRFPEDTDFWGTPCPRRRVQRSPQRDGAFVKEKERKEEKIRCRCRERVLTRCSGRDHSLERCSRCCGAHCPHPSYLFFR